MQTVFTDKYNILPFIFTWLGLRTLWHSYAEWQQGAPFTAWFDAAGSVFFLAFAIYRVHDRRQARREGRDPSIVRVKDPS